MQITQEVLDKTLLKSLGIKITKFDKSEVCGTMPVDERTHQPFGYLHGGASVALAETLCSIGACLNVNLATHRAFGVEINANHIKSMRNGLVYGSAKPLFIGSNLQIWNIEITDQEKDLVCTSRCTLMVKENKN